VRWTVVALIALALAPSLAAANGRPPLTNGVYFRPGDARAIYLRSTAGLLISRDDGCSFRWVCERAIGYGGAFDPKYAVARDGTIFAATFEGLRVSRDGGCTWETATARTPRTDRGRIAELWIDAIDIDPNGHVWVATAESAGPNNVYRSTDGGVTFAPRGLPSTTVWWKSVEVAPSDPRRVYVTGYQVAGTPAARLYRSDDAGGRWTERPLGGGMRYGQTPIVVIGAVDPAQPNTLLLISIEANPPSGDRLYRSTDGGATFAEVLVTTDRLRDVLYAQDGTVYAATLGGGAFRSTDGGATFAPLASPPQLGCLGQRSDGALFGCGANWQPDEKALARTADATRWTEVFQFGELAGTLACAPGTTTHDLCEPRWPAMKQLFGATGPREVCPAVPAERPAPAASPASPASPATTKSGGCCDAGGGPLGAATLAGVLALARRRRTRGLSGATRW